MIERVLKFVLILLLQDMSREMCKNLPIPHVTLQRDSTTFQCTSLVHISYGGTIALSPEHRDGSNFLVYGGTEHIFFTFLIPKGNHSSRFDFIRAGNIYFVAEITTVTKYPRFH